MRDGEALRVTEGDDLVRALLRVPGCVPEQALRGWTEPDLVREWWNGELTVELRPGGPYTVDFRRLGETMAGTVLDHVPGELLVFGWAWARDPDPAPRRVRVTVRPENRGTLVEVEHGRYTDRPGEAEERRSHREGWAYFLPRLGDCLRRRFR